MKPKAMNHHAATRTKTLIALTCIALLEATPMPVAAQATQELKLSMEDPVVVAEGRVGQKQWGYYQFPHLSRLPDNSVLLCFSHNADAVETYGTECPAFLSRDDGKTWSPWKPKAPFSTTKPHNCVSEVFEGEFLYVPPRPNLDLRPTGLKLPKPASTSLHNAKFRIEECPPEIQEHMSHLWALRWTPATKAWNIESVGYDMRQGLVWTRKKATHDIPRTWFEHHLVKVGKELFYAEYRTQYRQPDGSVPKESASYCMVSSDNGKTFERRGTIALDTTGKNMMAEPALAPTTDGRLVCAIRQEPHPRALMLTYSDDGGRTWSKPVKNHPFGVFPNLLLLENGILVLSFGRPGVLLKFSMDGKGRTWTSPNYLIKGTTGRPTDHTCSYTGLLAAGKNEFLIAYSDFNHRNKAGKQCKGILVRRVRIDRP